MIDLSTLWEIVLVFAVVLAIAPTLGSYVGRVYLNRPAFGDRFLTPIESFFYRLLGTSPRISMRPLEYASAMLLVSAIGFVWVFLLLLYQQLLPLNPAGIGPMPWQLATHTSASFLTNTDFTHFTPEIQLSLGAALGGLQVDFFLSAAIGLSVTAAFVRGFIRKDGTVGNFYVDLVRSLTRILIPLSLLAAAVLVFLGLPQTFTVFVTAHPLTGGTQTIFLGPSASWQSIMLLGTNGGGFGSANAASPLQNPSPLSNLFETGLMLLLPLSFPFAFAEIVRKPGESLPYIGTILIVLIVALTLFIAFQGLGNPSLGSVPFLTGFTGNYPVGQETRFSLTEGGLFQVVSIYSNTGANNMALGSLTPGAQMVLLFGMFTQSTPGGDGTGFGNLLVFALVAVFIGGLMVGRTPEYLGKKIEKSHMKWAAAILLIHPTLALLPAAVGLLGGFVPGPNGGPLTVNAHNFTILLYEFTSESANNGSAMGPITDATPFFNLVGAFVMLFGRYFPILATLAIAALFSRQEELPAGPGTLQTRSATFTVYLTLLVLIITGLLFLPVLALGPLAQYGA